MKVVPCTSLTHSLTVQSTQRCCGAREQYTYVTDTRSFAANAAAAAAAAAVPCHMILVERCVFDHLIHYHRRIFRDMR